MNKLRLGLLIDDVVVPNWVYTMIESISKDNYAEITLVVKRKETIAAHQTFFSRIKEKFKSPLFKLYTKAENLIFKPSPGAFETKDITALIANAVFLEVTCVEKKFSDYLAESDIVKISEYEIDVFIRLGFRILRGEILKTAKMGIWSYHHGDNFLYRGGPAGFWEVLKQEREVGSFLQILTEDLDAGEVLYRSWSSVETSANKTLNNYYWKTSLFIPRELKKLHTQGKEFFFNNLKFKNDELHFYSGRNYTMPTNAQFLKYFLPFIFRRISHKLWKLFNFEQWTLLYSCNNDTGPSTAIYRYKTLIPPRDRYWADPCVIFKEDKHYVFFEEVINPGKTEKGHICVAEVGKKGLQSRPVVILDKPYHLSYPFVFEHEGQFYLIPESQEKSTIELYEAVKFPYEWKFKMNLMENIAAVDSTIFFKDNKVWLFTNISGVEGASSSDELFLFYADTLFTDKWESHPCNPIVSDVKSSRPAGRLFYHNNKLYRPSQDCSYRYGHSTIINEITELNGKKYSERKVSSINPAWNDKVVATHTISFDKGLSVIDATIKRRKRLFSIR